MLINGIELLLKLAKKQIFIPKGISNTVKQTANYNLRYDVKINSPFYLHTHQSLLRTWSVSQYAPT